MMRRKRKAILITVGVISVVIPIVAFVLRVYPGYARSEILEWNWRRQAIAALESALTSDELKQAVGHLGVFIPVAEGDWIAICYNDTHAGGIVSLAVALDSQGQWFESREHYCGNFSALYGWIEEQESQVPEADRMYEPVVYEGVDLRDLYHADDLDEARQVLARIGFSHVER